MSESLMLHSVKSIRITGGRSAKAKAYQRNRLFLVLSYGSAATKTRRLQFLFTS